MIIVLGECFQNNFFYEIKYITNDICLIKSKIGSKAASMINEVGYNWFDDMLEWQRNQDNLIKWLFIILFR